jgi:xylulokinase
MEELLLAIDVGMTNCKTVLFTCSGETVDRATIAYPTYHPQPGWVEQDPEAWWNALRQGLNLFSQRSPQGMASVVAISVTGHMHSLVCMGADGSALMPALVLGDQRSLEQAGRLSAQLGTERIYALTGTRMDASMPAAKLCWLREHAPNIRRQARAFVSCKDFIRHRMTGDLLTDPIDACGMSLYDVQQHRWSAELLAAVGISPSRLPKIADPCRLAGTLRDRPAEELGLRPGIPVVVGAGDDVEVLGNGIAGPGLSLEHLGTTGSILACADHPVFDPQMAVELYPHVIPGLWVLGGSVTAAGSALAWAQQLLRDVETSGLPECTDPGHPLVFMPHLAGERCPAWEPRARGAWIGLSIQHTSRHLQRAVLEGVAFSLKNVLDRVESLIGPQEQIMVADGQVDAPWRQLRADIYQRPLACINTGEPTALGAMIVAAVGIGAYDSVAAAVRRVTGVTRRVEPDSNAASHYRQIYRLYCAAQDTLRPLMQDWEIA